MKRFRGGHVGKAHRLVHRSTLGLRAIKKKMKAVGCASSVHRSLRVLGFKFKGFEGCRVWGAWCMVYGVGCRV